MPFNPAWVLAGYVPISLPISECKDFFKLKKIIYLFIYKLLLHHIMSNKTRRESAARHAPYWSSCNTQSQMLMNPFFSYVMDNGCKG